MLAMQSSSDRGRARTREPARATIRFRESRSLFRVRGLRSNLLAGDASGSNPRDPGLDWLIGHRSTRLRIGFFIALRFTRQCDYKNFGDFRFTLLIGAGEKR